MQLYVFGISTIYRKVYTGSVASIEYFSNLQWKGRVILKQKKLTTLIMKIEIIIINLTNLELNITIP